MRETASYARLLLLYSISCCRFVRRPWPFQQGLPFVRTKRTRRGRGLCGRIG